MSGTRIEVLKKLEGFLRSEEGKVDPKPTEAGVELVSIGNKQDANLPYLPYIGKDYFQQPFKVAFYAEAQNLNKDFVEKVVKCWEDCRVDGLGPGPIYRSYNYPFTEVGPWDGGFGRVICAMALAKLRKTDAHPGRIDDIVAVSNAFRFSYRKQTKRGWRNCNEFPQQVWNWTTNTYLPKEIAGLEPDIIVAMGGNAKDALQQAKKASGKNDADKPRIIFVHHSSGQNLKGSYQWCNKNARNALPQIEEAYHRIWELVSPYFPDEKTFADQKIKALMKLMKQKRNKNEVGEGATEEVNLQFIEKRWLYFAAALGAIREQLDTLKEDKQCL
jgi:hypothetical protein